MTTKKKQAAQERFDKTLFADANEAAKMDDVWNQGQEARNLPIGSFQADIASAVLERAQSSDRLQIHYELVILSGSFKDVKLEKYDGLETPEQTSITQSQLAALGVNVKKLTVATLPATLLKLTHQKAAIKTKQNGPFYNIYFQKLIVGTPKSVAARNDSGSRKRTAKRSKSTTRTAGKAF